MELAIKKNINKLPGFVPDLQGVIDQLNSNGFELLKLTNEQISAYQSLPVFNKHKDPFDRFLISVSIQEKLPILTTGTKFNLYSPIIQIV